MKFKKFNTDNVPVYKRWKFCLVWSAIAMAALVGYDVIHDLPEDLYNKHPDLSQDLMFWIWTGVNVFSSLVVGAFVTVADSLMDWAYAKRTKQDDDV